MQPHDLDLVEPIGLVEPTGLEVFEEPAGSPSPAHRELAGRSIRWVSNRMTEAHAATEVTSRGAMWDAAAVGWATSRLHYYLDTGEGQLILRHGASGHAVVARFEVKVSRADFMAGFGPKGKYRELAERGIAHGNLCYLVKPRIELPLDLLPPHWGVLEASGRGLALRKMPTWRECWLANEELDTLLRIMGRGPYAKWARVAPCPDCGVERTFNGEKHCFRYGE